MPVHTLIDSKRTGRNSSKKQRWHCAQEDDGTGIPKVVHQCGPDAMPSALESGLGNNGENSKSKQITSNEWNESNAPLLAPCYQLSSEYSILLFGTRTCWLLREKVLLQFFFKWRTRKINPFFRDTKIPFLKYHFKWLVQVDCLNDIHSILVPKYHEF